MKRLIVLASAAGAMAMAGGYLADSVDERPPLMVMTGHESDVAEARYRLAASQEVFDEVWVGHMGDRVTRAAQGWPMPPRIDFEACEAIFIFGGASTNTNGYRVMETIEAADAVTIRFEDISFQTSSLDGADAGVRARPWAMLLIEKTDKTVVLEQNVQGLIGGDPIWKERASFPGRIGVGRPVGGAAQRGPGGS